MKHSLLIYRKCCRDAMHCEALFEDTHSKATDALRVRGSAQGVGGREKLLIFMQAKQSQQCVCARAFLKFEPAMQHCSSFRDTLKRNADQNTNSQRAFIMFLLVLFLAT